MKVLNVFFLLVICDIELSSQDQEQELTWTNYHPFQVHQKWMQSIHKRYPNNSQVFHPLTGGQLTEA